MNSKTFAPELIIGDTGYGLPVRVYFKDIGSELHLIMGYSAHMQICRVVPLPQNSRMYVGEGANPAIAFGRANRWMEIAKMIENHPAKSYQEIAKECGVSKASVDQVALRFRLHRKSGRKPTVRGIEKEIVERVKGCPDKTYSEIGKEFGVSGPSVCQAARKAGLRRNKVPARCKD